MIEKRRGLSVILVTIVLLAGLSGGAGAEEAIVRIDCREGTGMVPTAWRALSLRPGHEPVDSRFDLRAVRLGPGFVAGAWENPDRWQAITVELNRLRARRMQAVVALPPPPTGGDDVRDEWLDLIGQTVGRLREVDVLYELTFDGGIAVEPALEAYESAAWAIVRLDAEARLGGPGADHDGPLVEALARRCRERRLPLHFLSWKVTGTSPGDVEASVRSAASVLNRHPQETGTDLVLSEWGCDGDISVGLSSLMGLMDTRLRIACASSPPSEAFSLFEQLGPVRLAPVVEGDPVRAVATMAGDEFRGIVWTHGNPGRVRLMLTGLPPGRQAEVERRIVGAAGPPPVERMRHTQPLEITLEVEPEAPVEVRVRTQ